MHIQKSRMSRTSQSLIIHSLSKACVSVILCKNVLLVISVFSLYEIHPAPRSHIPTFLNSPVMFSLNAVICYFNLV